MNTMLPSQCSGLAISSYFSFFDGSPDHCFFLDKSLHILHYNKNSSLVGKSFSRIVPLFDKKRHSERLQRVFNKQEAQKFYLEVYGEDSTCIKLEVSAFLVKAEHDCCVLVGQEVSDYRERNMDLEQKNQYLKEFVYNATHDLRSPLSVLKSFVDLIRRFDDEKKKEMALSQMREATINMEKKLTGMSDLVTMNKYDLQPASLISFKGIFTQSQYLLMNEIRDAEPEFFTNFEVEHIHYIGAHLLSICQNLLSNAIKYRKPDVPLCLNISTKREGAFVVFSVKDNGMGMDLDNFGHKLFKPFQRLTSAVKGTGIALSMIHNWIKRTGGRIEVTSELGKGSEFKVYLKEMDVPVEV